MPGDETLAEAASIERRLRFASWSRASLQQSFHRMGLHKIARRLGNTPYSAADLLYDLVEWPRSRFRLSHPGQVSIAALSAPIRLSQVPRHRGYWYDPQKHALIGMHLGLDLVQNQGKYYLIEANLGAALRPERRSLYCSKLDPFICELLDLATRHDFKKIVLHRARWTEEYLKEFELAQVESGIEIIGTSGPITAPRAPHHMIALPEELQENTIYVFFSGQSTPLSLFFHDKLWSGRWLQETIDAHPSEAELLTYVPTYDKLTLPTELQDPLWPNLVIKLANGDKGEYVLMGRFRSEAHALSELRLDGPEDIPGVFDISYRDRTLNRLFPWLQAIYQPYIPPEIVDGAIRKVRLHLFISPLANQFHSAHHTITTQPIPQAAPAGLIKDAGPYTVSFSSFAGRYVKAEGTAETELRRVAQEYGQIANMAVREKFISTP